MISIDDFNKLGFEYGDSVNVSFTNGYELTDIPYYNGYYVDEIDNVEDWARVKEEILPFDEADAKIFA